jgi:type IV pilus assembly protein PilQ
MMSYKTVSTLIVFAAGLMFNVTAAVAQEALKLERVEIVPTPGAQFEAKLHLSGPAPKPVVFTIENPARAVVDLQGTTLALPSRRIDVKSSGVDTITAGEAGGRSRIVFNLDKVKVIEAKAEGSVVRVSLASNEAGLPQAISKAASGQSALIEKVGFRRGKDGAAQIHVNGKDAGLQANLKVEGGKLMVDFPDAKLSEGVEKRYEVTDFATPVTAFTVTRSLKGSRIAVEAAGDFEHLAYQTDKEYVLEVRQKPKPVATPGLGAPGTKTYKGEKLTLAFQDIEARAVLQLLAETSGKNIVVSDTVQGNVTLRLQNVPWDQALDIVLRTRGLDKREEGNIIYVAPAEELAAREKQELERNKAMVELAPVRTEYLQVNYAKASDLASLIKSQGKSSLLSERGSVSIDERTNTLLLQDTAERLAEIRKLISSLDIPIKQVLIEARIVIVNDDFSRELGVRFGGAYFDNYNGGKGLAFLGPNGLNTSDGEGPTLTPNGGGVPPGGSVTLPPTPERYLVNLPVANPAGKLAMTLLSSNYIVDLELSAAQNEGRGEVISSPRIITANGKEATIEQGTEIPYQESASSGATTTQFKKAVLLLKVTPQITPDNRVLLDLTVSKDSVGQVVPSATGGFVPSIDTREINTQVLVNDGQTVVLGGILETEKRDSVNKVPYLSSIPGLGALFRSKQNINNKDELLIFVTPRILREGEFQ